MYSLDSFAANTVAVKSIMDMRLAYYKSVANHTTIDAFVATAQDYYDIKCMPESRRAFIINAKGEETIFGVPFKLLRD